MALKNITPPNERAGITGEGGHGLDYLPADLRQMAGGKARAVLDGTQTFSYAELQNLLARLVVEVGRA